MPQEERYGTRSLIYSAWHRRMSTKRFIGEDAVLLAMIDLDIVLWIEYNDKTKEPLCLIETAEDVGQSFKAATITTALARKAGILAYVVLYTVDPHHCNPAAPPCPDIQSFRVRQAWPPQEPPSTFVTLTPKQWAVRLLDMRRTQGRKRQ